MMRVPTTKVAKLGGLALLAVGLFGCTERAQFESVAKEIEPPLTALAPGLAKVKAAQSGDPFAAAKLVVEPCLELVPPLEALGEAKVASQNPAEKLAGAVRTSARTLAQELTQKCGDGNVARMDANKLSACSQACTQGIEQLTASVNDLREKASAKSVQIPALGAAAE